MSQNNLSINMNIALTVLKKYDSKCKSIIDFCSRVKLYNYDINSHSWIMQEQCEATLYLVMRFTHPFYKFIILSKENKANQLPHTTEVEITQYLQYQRHNNLYMFKDESGLIRAIHFLLQQECDRLCSKIDGIVSELKKSSSNCYVTPTTNDLGHYIEKTMNLNATSSSISNATSAPIKSDVLSSFILQNHSRKPQTSNSQIQPQQHQDKLLNLLESAKQKASQTSSNNLEVNHRARPIAIQELFGPSTAAPLSSSNNSKLILPPPPNPLLESKQSQMNNQIDFMSNKTKSTTKHQPICTMSTPNNCNDVPITSSQLYLETSTNSGQLPVQRSRKTTLTVTELEKKLVQDASVDHTDSNIYALSTNNRHYNDDNDDEDDDDDDKLLDPQSFLCDDNKINPLDKLTPNNRHVHSSNLTLDKEALRDALINLLQSDEDGSFISLIHSAYLDTKKNLSKK